MRACVVASKMPHKSRGLMKITTWGLRVRVRGVGGTDLCAGSRQCGRGAAWHTPGFRFDMPGVGVGEADVASSSPA